MHWMDMMTVQQRKILNAACGDLADQVIWHGLKLSKDDYRHMIAGTVLRFRTMPGIDMGDGTCGWIMLGGSSLDLKKSQCMDAITIAFHIGDDPSSQRLKSPPVKWCQAVRLARGIPDNET